MGSYDPSKKVKKPRFEYRVITVYLEKAIRGDKSAVAELERIKRGQNADNPLVMIEAGNALEYLKKIKS